MLLEELFREEEDFVFKEEKHEECIDTVSEQKYNTITDTTSALK